MDECASRISSVCASIQQFAHDVIAPTMMAEHRGVAPKDKTPVILGTLLILREVMTQNAKAIFGEEAILSGLDEEAPADERAIQENVLFSSHFLATSVIYAGLEGAGPGSAVLTQTFVAMMESYDSGGDDFALCLSPMEFTCTKDGATLPSGNTMGEEELLAWQISYKLVLIVRAGIYSMLSTCLPNPLFLCIYCGSYHCENHPTAVRNRKRRLGGGISTEVTCPERDTVHISVLEEQLRKRQGTKRTEEYRK
jgi:hypothetical protein